MTRSTSFRFRTYDADEAAEAGRAFLGAFDALKAGLVDCHDTHHWTEATLDWFANAAPEQGVVVDASPATRLRNDRLAEQRFENALDDVAPPSPARRGACLLDLAHHRLLDYAHYREREAYWRKAYAEALQQNAVTAPEMLLGLESEAGSEGNASLNTHRVMEDASKLLPFATRIKVVVFGSNDLAERARIQELADLLAKADYSLSRAGRPPVWLWLDIPWASRWTKKHGLAGWIDTAGAGGARVEIGAGK